MEKAEVDKCCLPWAWENALMTHRPCSSPYCDSREAYSVTCKQTVAQAFDRTLATILLNDPEYGRTEQKMRQMLNTR